MNLLKELKRERGIAMLFITHDLALASDLCDRIAVVYAGQLRELGSAEAVIGDPRDPYTERLMASIPRLYADTRARVPARACRRTCGSRRTGCRFAARCPVVFEQCAEPPPLVEVAPGHLGALLAGARRQWRSRGRARRWSARHDRARCASRACRSTSRSPGVLRVSRPCAPCATCP